MAKAATFNFGANKKAGPIRGARGQKRGKRSAAQRAQYKAALASGSLKAG